MVNFILIAVCMIAGMLFRYSKIVPADTHKGLNAWIIYIALPAVSFKYLPYIHWSKEMLIPALAPVVVWVGGWLTALIISRFFKIDKRTHGGINLSSGLSNTSFVGFALITAYFGEKYISIAIICDQATFLILATAGIVTAIRASKKQAISLSLVASKVLRFPPFLGCMAALIIPHFVDIAPISPLFEKLAATVAPLALFSIGLQMKFSGWRDEIKLVSSALLYKLIIAPLVVLIIVFSLGYKGIISQISIFEAAMPTLVTSAVVADEYGLNPKLCNLIVGVGIILSLITTAGWWFILK